MKTYYNEPTMVKCLDTTWELLGEETEEDRPHLYGIAYRNELICGCCGSILEIEELIEGAEELGIDLEWTELYWIDIIDAIKGE